MAEIYEITRRQLHLLVVSATVVIVLVLMLGVVVGKNISLPQRFPSAADLAQQATNDPGKLETSEITNLRSTTNESSTKPYVENEGHTFYEKLDESSRKETTKTVVEPFSARPAADSGGESGSAGVTNETGSMDNQPTPDVFATAGPDAAVTYVVQTSSVSNKSFADESVKKLTAKGYPAYISNIRFKTGKENFRVRIGPYGSKETAEAVSRRIKSELNTTPLLMTLQKGER